MKASKPLLNNDELPDEKELLNDERLEELRLDKLLLDEQLLNERLVAELLDEEPGHPVRSAIAFTRPAADRHAADPKTTFARLAAFIWFISDLHFK